MKLGYHTIRWGFHNVSRAFPKILNEISEAGFNAFEAQDIDVVPFLENTKGFFGILSENKIHLIGVYCPGQLIGKSFVDSLIIKYYFREIRHFTKFAEFVASSGGEMLSIGGTVGRKATKNNYFPTLAKTINSMGKICANLNISLSYHPILETIIKSEQEISRLCELTDADTVGFTLDTGHLSIAGVNLIQLISKHGKRINHVHFKDVKDGKFVELGEGVIDFPNIMQALKQIGYNGWIVIEDEINSPSNPWASTTTRTPLETAKNSKRLLNELKIT